MSEKHLDRNSKIPLYAQLKESLVQRISAGEFAEGDLLPSINELCGEYKVSAITVRQALQQLSSGGLLSKKPGWGTCVTNAIAPSSNKRPSILLLDHRGVPMWDEYSFDIKKVIEGYISRAGFALQYGPTDPEWLGAFLAHHSEDARGLILLSGSYRSLKPFIDPFELPVVAFSRDPETVDRRHIKDIVDVDGYKGTYEVVSYLAGLGHTRIGSITLAMDSHAGKQRATAVQDALDDKGIKSDPRLIIEAGFSVSDGKVAAQRMLDSGSPPTAIVCANDYLALGAISEILGRGLRIPHDISVTGFDNIEMSAFSSPPLTTVSLDRGRVGAMLARLMVERLANPEKAFTVEIISAEIKIRQSCREVTQRDADSACA